MFPEPVSYMFPEPVSYMFPEPVSYLFPEPVSYLFTEPVSYMFHEPVSYTYVPWACILFVPWACILYVPWACILYVSEPVSICSRSLYPCILYPVQGGEAVPGQHGVPWGGPHYQEGVDVRISPLFMLSDCYTLLEKSFGGFRCMCLYPRTKI